MPLLVICEKHGTETIVKALKTDSSFLKAIFTYLADILERK
jgi:hypothetical protein